jgi:transposase
MLLNGLGFTGRTLHMHSEYFESKPLERLLGEGIMADDINDDLLGCCLDALYDKGILTLFQGIGESVVKHLDLPCHCVFLDPTSFHYCLKDRQRTIIECLGEAFSKFILKRGAECQLYMIFL